MKLAIKLFNGVIMLIALAAAIFLFASPTFSFNSNVSLNVKTLCDMLPSTEYVDPATIPTLLGTDDIHLGIQFEIRLGELNTVMTGDKDTINEKVVKKSMDDLVTTLKEPIDLITDIVIKSSLKELVTQQITKYLDQARQKYSSDKTLEEVMNDVGIDDEYFTNFSLNLYNAACADDVSVNSLGDFLFAQIDETLAMADDSRAIDSSDFNDETRTQAQDSMVNILNQLHLVEEDHVTLKKLNEIAYVYTAEYLVPELDGKVPAEQLTKQTGETYFDYSDRLLHLWVYNIIPVEVYQGVGYFATGCMVALFTCGFVWLFLFVWTLIKTLSDKKPWTIFGIWFWIAGAIQVIIGVVLTVFGKMVLPNMNLPIPFLPVSHLYLVPRTFALVPSILFLLCIPLGIAYSIIRSKAKQDAKNRGII